MKYRADIDGLRAVAVLAVVLYHAGVTALGGGFVGVDVFFVISGYVISRRLTEDLRLQRFSIADFYVRRVKRIFPALFVMVVLTWIAAAILFLPDQFYDLSQSTLATALFSSNFYFWRNSGYFDTSAHLRPLLHTWSLAVEEQYYIFMPVAMYVVARFGKQRWGWFFIPAFLLSLAASIYGTRVAPTATFMLLPTRTWELLLGALLVLIPLRPLKSQASVEIIGAAGLASIAYAVFAFTENTPFPGANALFPCVGAALLIYAGESERRGMATRTLALPPLVWTGLISYSLYLAHWPLIVFSRYTLLRDFTPWETIGLIVASFCIAVLSYRFIEQPLRHLKPGSRPAPILIRSLVVLAVIGALGLSGTVTRGFPRRFPEFVEHKIPGHDEWKTGTCFLSDEQTWRAWNAKDCTRTTGHTGKTLVWGDSFAAHYIPGLMQRGEIFSDDVVQYTAAGCRPIMSLSFYSVPHCHEFNTHVEQVIKDLNIDTVIIAARWSNLRSRGLDDLRETTDRLGTLGVKVYVIGQSPEFPIDVQILAYRQAAEKLGQFGQWDVSFDPKINVELRSLLGNSATFIDPVAVLCAGTLCPYVQNKTFLYSDFGHFSATGSEMAISRYISDLKLHQAMSDDVGLISTQATR